MKTFKLFFTIAILIFSTSGCKKDKLTGDNKTLIGTWTSISTMAEPGNCGFVAGHSTNPNLKLTLMEKGRYKLYSGDKKIETGRLIIKNGFVTFEDIQRKSTLSGRTILKFNSDSLNIDRNGCGDDYVFRFVKN
jgi:hypothetical protein